MSIGDSLTVVGVGAGGAVTSADITDSTAAGRALLTRSTLMHAYIPLGVDASSGTIDGSQGTVSVGGVPGEIDPADYAVTGLSLAWTLRVTAQVTSGDTLTVTLRNLTDSTDAATIAVTATTPTNHSVSATIAASKVYALQASVSGGTVADIGTIYSAALRAAWS